jgi:hypothetical protein
MYSHFSLLVTQRPRTTCPEVAQTKCASTLKSCRRILTVVNIALLHWVDLLLTVILRYNRLHWRVVGHMWTLDDFHGVTGQLFQFEGRLSTTLKPDNKHFVSCPRFFFERLNEKLPLLTANRTVLEVASGCKWFDVMQCKFYTWCRVDS